MLAGPRVVTVGVHADRQVQAEAQARGLEAVEEPAELLAHERLRHEVEALLFRVDVLRLQGSASGGLRPGPPVPAESRLRATESHVPAQLVIER